MWLRFVLVLCCFSISYSYEIYKQIQIQNVNEDDISLFQFSGIDIDHAHYVKGELIEFAISENDIPLLQGLGYDYTVIHSNLQDFYQSRLTENYTREFGLGSMGGYYTLDEAIQRLDDIHNEYPELVSEKISLGESLQGRNIYAIKLSDNVNEDEDEVEVLYTGMHHAREPMSFMNLYYYIYWLLENYNIDDRATKILNSRELWFIPIVNPDGYEYNRSIAPNGGGMQRKNMRETCNSSADGIDLNRNYDFQWGYDNQGSSGDGCSETYRGSNPFSEPETNIVKDFVDAHDFPIALNYHSYGNLMIHPWGYQPGLSLPLEDDLSFQEIGQEMTRYNNYLLGTGIETVGYTVNGEACDWMYGAKGIIAFTPEIGNNSDGFWPSSNRIVPLAEENLHPNIVTALYAGPLLNSEFNIQDGPYIGSEYYNIDVILNNIGLSQASGITTLEFISVAGIEFTEPIIEVDDMDPRSSIELENATSFYVSPYIPAGIEVEIVLLMTMEDGTTTESSTEIILGEPQAVVEYDFEGNNLELWEFSGDADWYLTTENSNSGVNSFRSGYINNNEESITSINIFAETISTIEFSYRVSSEYSPSGNNFYDGLTFYIDNDSYQYQPEIDGNSPWKHVEFTIDPGEHTLRWVYSKDGGGGATDCNNTGCDDAAYIDDLVMLSYVENPMVSGDINFDQQIDILDIVLLVNFVLEANYPSQSEFIASDVNADETLNVLDVVQLVNMILN